MVLLYSVEKTNTKYTSHLSCVSITVSFFLRSSNSSNSSSGSSGGGSGFSTFSFLFFFFFFFNSPFLRYTNS